MFFETTLIDGRSESLTADGSLTDRLWNDFLDGCAPRRPAKTAIVEVRSLPELDAATAGPAFEARA
jgi:hypothetical protein